ncbi:MAG: hypothetical protein NT121_00365 [Chloroflexi bacterium]|nr:hypothetical protein [Chloroflexota bacterium]
MPLSETVMIPIIETFCQVALRALIRAEWKERVPARFTGVGQDVWKTVRNELTLADLLVLGIQDAAVNMPIPFDPQRWLPVDDGVVPAWSELQVSPEAVQSWLSDAHQQAQLPLDDYLRRQAALLSQSLPDQSALDKLPTPQKHEHWLELPGSGGWAAYSLCSRAEQELYLWENFTILCVTPQEMMLAGLIAWELGAPPNLELPILLDDANLTGVLNSAQTFHTVVGKRAEHGHRDLRCLHKDNKHPLWL